MKIASLVPELDVTDLDASLRFYVQVLGFSVCWARAEERFAFLQREDAQLMLEEAAGPGRRFTLAVLERPYGRGVNFQIACSDVDALHAAVLRAGHTACIPLEDRGYRVGTTTAQVRQFVVADPDGYLLRFVTSLD
jgi:catechol 2,3-dioxygenase-like lactoylglutathione lyase family enzyme